MTNTFQDKILRSSIPLSIKFEAKTIDLGSSSFYERLSFSTVTVISLAQSFTEIYQTNGSKAPPF